MPIELPTGRILARPKCELLRSHPTRSQLAYEDDCEAEFDIIATHADCLIVDYSFSCSSSDKQSSDELSSQSSLKDSDVESNCPRSLPDRQSSDSSSTPESTVNNSDVESDNPREDRWDANANETPDIVEKKKKKRTR
jgi:hypothetical protein